MLNCHAVCACGMINDLWRLQSISSSHFCRGREEGREEAEKNSLGPNPKLYWLLPVRLFFLEHLSGWTKFNNCELCAVCFLFYRFVSRNFYDYFGPVTETDEETRLWLVLRLELRLWPVMVMGEGRRWALVGHREFNWSEGKLCGQRPRAHSKKPVKPVAVAVGIAGQARHFAFLPSSYSSTAELNRLNWLADWASWWLFT